MGLKREKWSNMSPFWQLGAQLICRDVTTWARVLRTPIAKIVWAKVSFGLAKVGRCRCWSGRDRFKPNRFRSNWLEP